MSTQADTVKHTLDTRGETNYDPVRVSACQGYKYYHATKVQAA